MLHVGLDLSRKRLDFDLLCEDGSRLERGAVPPDADGLRGLARRVNVFGERVCAAIESMNGARFVHDRLEELGWQVEIADAQKAKGLAPLACKIAQLALAAPDLSVEVLDRLEARVDRPTPRLRDLETIE